MATRTSGITQECIINTTDCEKEHYTPSPADKELLVTTQTTERRLRTKIDFAICPIVCLLYLFCYIDRANIGNARIAGLERELGLHGYDFNTALTCYSAAYASIQIPATICCKWIGPGWFLPGVTLAFGIASICTGLVRTSGQLFAVRCLVGVFESGLMPGIAYYLSRWYRRAELGFRLSFYIAMAPMAGAFGGLLASGILSLPGIGALHGWRMIFVVEGIITVGLSIVAFALLTDRPETARWLTPEERQLVSHRVTSERLSGTVLLDNMGRKKLWRGVANPVTLATGSMYLMNAVTVQGLGFFLPTIIATIYPDASVTRQQLYTVPPYVIGAFFTVAFSGLSWMLDRRQIIMTISALPILTGYAIFLGTLDPHARYAATFLVASTCTTMGSMTSAQISCNVVTDTARSAAMATNVMFASLGGLISTWSFLPFDGPRFPIGNGLNLATSSTWCLIGIGISAWMRFDNRRRDSKDSVAELSGLDKEEVGDLDWKHPDFRWRP
ncbi:mfs transporter protein [Diaporthe eres]|uniref:Major facilitator superfamily (MFS) profile domain-containing protein n=1 Tax=Diaporthe vaccinii TaxID=105482 RepID=A0ABR4E298_9PEZI|nr:mfs transporter protein [Diaporthe eres]